MVRTRGALLTLSLVCFLLLLAVLRPASVYAATTFYVSKNGNNTTGLSWANAWNELNQINWAVVGPGDTIILDGGSTSMTYSSSLAPTIDGVAGSPILIRLSYESGRNGKVVIGGGRTTALPYCGQTGYTYQTSGVRLIGIDLGSHDYITIDGTKWRGIAVTGHNKFGVDTSATSDHITLKNLDIYDNGKAINSGSSWAPDLPGIDLNGSNHTLERVILSNNGQDGIQSGGSISNLTVKESLFENDRVDGSGNPWNYCRHPDGIQIYGGGVQSGVTIEDSVFGPGLMQGVMLGGGGNASDPINTWAVINNVTIRNTLFFKAGNASIHTNTVNGANPTGWLIDNVTSYRVNAANYHNVFIEGTGHTVQDSVFYGGVATSFPDGTPTYSNNCRYNVTGGINIGDNTDPNFSDVANNVYTVQAAGCSGRGSSIISKNALLGLSNPATPTPTATPTNTQEPTPTPLPTATNTPTPTPTPTPVPLTLRFDFEVENCTITSPFSTTSGSPTYVSQSSETTDPTQGGKLACTFTVDAPGVYAVRVIASTSGSGSNSIFIDMDDEPVEPTTIFDTFVTGSANWWDMVVSWRGTGGVTTPEFHPKLFDMTPGEHTVIIRGREANTKLDKLTIIRVWSP